MFSEQRATQQHISKPSQALTPRIHLSSPLTLCSAPPPFFRRMEVKEKEERKAEERVCVCVFFPLRRAQPFMVLARPSCFVGVVPKCSKNLHHGAAATIPQGTSPGFVPQRWSLCGAARYTQQQQQQQRHQHQGLGACGAVGVICGVIHVMRGWVVSQIKV